MVSTTDGTAVTAGSPTVYYTIDAGTQGTGTGTITHEGNGQWSYAVQQAECNGDHVAFTMALSGAVSVCINVYPVSVDPTDAVRMGITALPNTAFSGTGGFVMTEANELDVNIISVSGSSSASDNMELVFDSVTGDFSDAYDVSINQWRATISGTPDVNVIQVNGNTTAPTSMVELFATDWATAYDSTNNKLNVLADVTAISGSTTAADNVEITYDTDRSTNYANNKFQVEADVTAISGDTTSADNLEESTNGIIPFTVQSGTLSTTAMSTNLAEGSNEHYTNSTVIMLTGALAGQRRKITSYTGTGGIIGFAAMTEAASAGDTGVIV